MLNENFFCQKSLKIINSNFWRKAGGYPLSSKSRTPEIKPTFALAVRSIAFDGSFRRLAGLSELINYCAKCEDDFLNHVFAGEISGVFETDLSQTAAEEQICKYLSIFLTVYEDFRNRVKIVGPSLWDRAFSTKGLPLNDGEIELAGRVIDAMSMLRVAIFCDSRVAVDPPGVLLRYTNDFIPLELALTNHLMTSALDIFALYALSVLPDPNKSFTWK
ncbi:MAG: hypothetical protein ACK4XM_12790 [Chloroherpetonaceae bacterium]